MNITEDYVSYEVAKLLKEKGFNEPVTGLNKLLFKEGEKPVLKITHQKAMRWLREVHLLHIYAEYKAFFQERPKKLYYHWMPFIKPLPKCKYQIPQNKVCIELDKYCDSYEEAVEAALKYVLENLI